MAAGTTQFALLVDQLMPALQTEPPVLAGNIFCGRRGADIRRISFIDLPDFHKIDAKCATIGLLDNPWVCFAKSVSDGILSMIFSENLSKKNGRSTFNS